MKLGSRLFLSVLLVLTAGMAWARVELEGGPIIQDPNWNRGHFSVLDDDTCTIDYTGMVHGGGNPGTIHWPGGSYSGPMGAFGFDTNCDPNPLYAYCVDLDHRLNQGPYCAVIFDTPINENCAIQIPAMAYVLTWYEDTSAAGDDILQMALWKFNNDPDGTPYYCPPDRANEDSVFHSSASVNDPANAWVTFAAGEVDGIPKNVIVQGDLLTLSTPGPIINGSMSDLAVDIYLTRGAKAISLGNTSLEGVKIILSTSEGTLDEDTVFTDEFGHAQVVASNPIDEGIVPVTMMACTKGYWPRSVLPCGPSIHSQGLVVAPFRTVAPFDTCVELHDRFLAAELASFDAFSGDNGINLTWHSVSETNLDRWEIERRINGVPTFNRLASIPAADQISGYTYRYTDQSAEPGVVYDYRLVDVDMTGTRTPHDDLVRTASFSGGEESLPNRFYLADNYPNPFNPETRIRFSLAESGFASLRIYNAVGREVAVLANGKFSAGEHAVNFRAENLPSGLYFYKLSSGGSSITKKMILMK